MIPQCYGTAHLKHKVMKQASLQMSHYLVSPSIEPRRGTVFISFLYASCCFNKSEMLPLKNMIWNGSWDLVS